MTKAILRAAGAALLLQALAGCAQVIIDKNTLNDPARSTPGPMVANVAKPATVLYETQSQGDLQISYNLLKNPFEPRGYFLRLIMRNNGASPVTVNPSVALADDTGIVIDAADFQSFVADAAARAGTPIPAVALAPGPSTYYSHGTVTNDSTGQTASYNATTTTGPSGAAAGFAAGFANGAANARAQNAANEQVLGRTMLEWSTSYWLKNQYTVPAGGAVVGALFFPSTTADARPLHLKVNLSGIDFSFLTARDR